MDLTKLSRGDTVIGVSGLVLFVVSFFDWLGVTITGGATFNGRSIGGVSLNLGSANAWHFTLTILAVLLGLVMLVYVVMKALGVDMPDSFGTVTLGQVMLGIAVVAFLFVLIKLIAGPNIGFTGAATVSKSRKFGIYVGLAATVGLMIGAFLNLQESTA